MMKKILILPVLLTVFCAPAFAIDWQTNPVFLRGVKDNTFFTSYRATIGGGDIHNISNSVAGSYETYLSADDAGYYHGMYIGYVHILSPESNFGTFVSHSLGATRIDGDFTQTYPALNRYFLDDYDKDSLTNSITLDAVYTKKLSDTVALGASFNFDYSFYRDTISYETIETDRWFRNATYKNSSDIYYFGGTLGLGWIPVKNLELDFSVEAGGFTGNVGYDELIYNFPADNTSYDFDDVGTYSGWKIRTEMNGTYVVSKKFRIPFSVSYTYKGDKQAYDGSGIFTNSTGVRSIYTKYYEEKSSAHTTGVGIGLKFYPTGSADDWSLYCWGSYKYYNSRSDVDSITDETRAGVFSGLGISESDVEYNNNTLSISIGANVPLMEHLRLTTGLNYSYTFISMDQDQTNYRNGALYSEYDYSSDMGFSYYLGAKVGFNYSMLDDRLNIKLISTIPIMKESKYVLDGTNNLSIFLPDPISSDTKRMDYSVILSISYSF
jgi:hypothetical protein